VRIFISSPYSNGDTITDADTLQANVDRSIVAAEQLANRGHVPFLPLLSHYWQQQFAHDHAFWLRWCLVWLAQCEAMLRLDGSSLGASIEERAANEIGMVVYRRIEDVPDGGKE